MGYIWKAVDLEELNSRVEPVVSTSCMAKVCYIKSTLCIESVHALGDGQHLQESTCNVMIMHNYCVYLSASNHFTPLTYFPNGLFLVLSCYHC